MANEGKHTPGPWDVGDSGILVFGGSVLVADCAPELPGAIDEDGDAIRANARLIAAAPEMLEALREALAYGGPERFPWTDLARAAIAKAEGR